MTKYTGVYRQDTDIVFLGDGHDKITWGKYIHNTNKFKDYGSLRPEKWKDLTFVCPKEFYE